MNTSQAAEKIMQFELRQVAGAWEAYDTINRYAPFFGKDEMEMRTVVERLNAGQTAYPKAETTGAADQASRMMQDAFGLRSHAKPGQCHYCGLNARTCDCN